MSKETSDGWSSGEITMGTEFDLEKGEDPEAVLLEKTAWLKGLVGAQFGAGGPSQAASNGSAPAGEPAAGEEDTESEVGAEDPEEVEVDG